MDECDSSEIDVSIPRSKNTSNCESFLSGETDTCTLATNQLGHTLLETISHRLGCIVFAQLPCTKHSERSLHRKSIFSRVIVCRSQMNNVYQGFKYDVDDCRCWSFSLSLHCPVSFGVLQYHKSQTVYNCWPRQHHQTVLNIGHKRDSDFGVECKNNT